jgi:hypothetical protein
VTGDRTVTGGLLPSCSHCPDETTRIYVPADAVLQSPTHFPFQACYWPQKPWRSTRLRALDRVSTCTKVAPDSRSLSLRSYPCFLSPISATQRPMTASKQEAGQRSLIGTGSEDSGFVKFSMLINIRLSPARSLYGILAMRSFSAQDWGFVRTSLLPSWLMLTSP